MIKKGNIIEKIWFYLKNKFLWKNEFAYNDKNDLIKRDYYSDDLIIAYSLKFEYDKWGIGLLQLNVEQAFLTEQLKEKLNILTRHKILFALFLHIHTVVP